MLIFISSRLLCKDDFLGRIHRLAKGKPDALMLREKDMSLGEYEELAMKINDICKAHQVPLIVNQHLSVAAKLKIGNLHLSMNHLRKYTSELQPFLQIGASVHSVDEAIEAEKLGATYLIAGHIFRTDCKKGVPPRGLPFLQQVCDSVSIPVFAIGGITAAHMKNLALAGAQGGCIMSEAMTCPNPEELVKQFRVGVTQGKRLV